MAERILKTTGWTPIDPTKYEGLDQVTADHHKVTKVELFLKTDQSAAFPSATSATYTRQASDEGDTYYDDNRVWHFPILHNTQWYRLTFHGIVADEPTNYVRNIVVHLVEKGGRH